MRVLSLRQTERRREVFVEVGGSGDGGEDGLVDGLLVGSLRFGERLLLGGGVGGSGLEEFSLSSVAGAGLVLGEVSVVEFGVDLKSSILSVSLRRWRGRRRRTVRAEISILVEVAIT